jgi:GT2 family glycosyltransferase
MDSRVCALVVTYNRKNLLVECIHSLQRQTRPIDQIVIVDNKSTDGTPSLLAAEFPDLPVVILPENLGGAGGFHAGMKWAYERGFDWIWIMDDDIETLPNALEIMLGYSAISEFIHVRREGPDGLLALEAIWDTGSCYPILYGDDPSFKDSTRDWISFPFGNFEGALIHRNVVSKIGYPDPRFFIAGDDTIYGFLASFHTNVIYVRTVGIIRKLPRPTVRNRMNYYLTIRNRFLMYEHMLRRGVPLTRSMFRINLIYLLLYLMRDAFGEGLRRSSLSQSITNTKALLSGLRDGMRGRFGRPPFIK